MTPEFFVSWLRCVTPTTFAIVGETRVGGLLRTQIPRLGRSARCKRGSRRARSAKDRCSATSIAPNGSAPATVRIFSKRVTKMGARNAAVVNMTRHVDEVRFSQVVRRPIEHVRIGERIRWRPTVFFEMDSQMMRAQLARIGSERAIEVHSDFASDQERQERRAVSCQDAAKPKSELLRFWL